MITAASKNKGFTLIELLVAMAIGSIVLAAIVSAYQVQVKSKISQDITIDMQQTARAALQIMASDIRAAGCDPQGSADNAGFLTADSADIQVGMDIDDDAINGLPDGDTDEVGEQVRYVLNGDQLQRDIGDGSGLTTLFQNVDALDFYYVNGQGNEESDPDEIRSVEVTIVVRSDREPWLSGYVNNKTYQNMRNEDIFGPAGDGLRRMRLTKTIYCRNMGL